MKKYPACTASTEGESSGSGVRGTDLHVRAGDIFYGGDEPAVIQHMWGDARTVSRRACRPAMRSWQAASINSNCRWGGCEAGLSQFHRRNDRGIVGAVVGGRVHVGVSIS